MRRLGLWKPREEFYEMGGFNPLERDINGGQSLCGKMDVKEELFESSFCGVGRQQTDDGGLRSEWG